MKSFPRLPNPHPDFAGRGFVERKAREAFSRMAKLWTPRGEENEPTHCTVSRYAQQLIDRATGKAYSADELPQKWQAAAYAPLKSGSDFIFSDNFANTLVTPTSSGNLSLPDPIANAGMEFAMQVGTGYTVTFTGDYMPTSNGTEVTTQADTDGILQYHAYGSAWRISRIAITAADITDPENLVTNERVNTAIAEDPAATKRAFLTNPIRSAQPISHTTGPHGSAKCWTVAGTTASMARGSFTTPAYAVKGLQLVFQSVLVNVDGSLTPTPSVQVRAAVEYPSGTAIPVFFNGKRDVEINSSGTVVSDVCNVRIPASTQYWVRVFAVAKTGELTAMPATMRVRSAEGGGVWLGSPGSAATATLTVSGGAITAVTLTSAGSGYTPNSEITCTITGAGSGAVVKAYSNAIGSIEPFFHIASAGTGYSSPTLAIPGAATGAFTFGSQIPRDATTITSILTSATYGAYGPSAILAIPQDQETHRSYVVIGDSIGAGYYDTSAGWDGWPYRVSTSYGASLVNISIAGISAQTGWAQNSGIWTEFAASNGATDAIVALGVNDLIAGRTFAQIQADLTTLIQNLQNLGLRVSVTTLTPITSNSDIPYSYESDRVSLNNWLRSKPLGIDQVFDVADAVETSRDSGVWKSGHVYTSESNRKHPSATGFDAMALKFAEIEL